MLKFIYLRYPRIAIVRNSNLILIDFFKSLFKSFLMDIDRALKISVIFNRVKNSRYIKFSVAFKLIII